MDYDWGTEGDDDFSFDDDDEYDEYSDEGEDSDISASGCRKYKSCKRGSGGCDCSD